MKRNKPTDNKIWNDIDEDLDSSLTLEADDSFKGSPIYRRLQMRKNMDLSDENEIADGEIIDCGII